MSVLRVERKKLMLEKVEAWHTLNGAGEDWAAAEKGDGSFNAPVALERLSNEPLFATLGKSETVDKLEVV